MIKLVFNLVKLKEMIITKLPILLGDSIPLFGHLNRDLKFKCEKVEFISEYLIKHYYRRIGKIGKSELHRIQKQ